jgi:hypothetical protein
MGQDAEHGIPADPAEPQQRDQEQGHGERNGKHPDGRSDPRQKADRHAEQRRMRRGIAEIGHAAPHDEAAERASHQRHADTGDDRAHEEIVEHVLAVL